MLSIIGFLIILAPLVIVHELGHFLFARLFNVKAEAFSVGFGPVVWAKKIGETDWRLSLFPLGGYVKLLGEEPGVELSPEDAPRALSRQAPYKRFFIFFGGPLFNFLFAILVFMAILLIGEDQLANRVGRVLKNTPASVAGIAAGDEILEVNGQAVRKYEDIVSIVSELPSAKVSLLVKDGMSGESKNIEVPLKSENGFSVYGEEKEIGDFEGLFPMSRSLVVGVSNPKSIAGQNGWTTGEEILDVNAVKVKNFEEVELIFNRLPMGEKLVITSNKNHVLEVEKNSSAQTLGELAGIHSSELFIDKTVKDSPAEKAGLAKGDRIVKIADVEVQSFFELKDLVQKQGESTGKISVQYERDGLVQSTEIVPTATQVRDPLLNKKTQYTIGIAPMLSWAAPITIKERVLNPFLLVYEATKRTFVFTWRNFVSIKKMVTGEVSVAAMGGPILIGKIAGESLARGLSAFLNTMAVLSVGLGFLNLLPVPVLDGGHLMMLGIEVIRGKPLTIRQMEVLQQVGLSLILLLMVVVMKNDITRLFNF